MITVLALEGTAGATISVSATGDPQGLPADSFTNSRGGRARTGLLTVEGGPIRAAWEDTDVTDDKAHRFNNGDAIRLTSPDQIARFRFKNANSEQPAVVKFTGFW